MEMLGFRRARGSFGRVLGAIVVAIVFQMAAPDSDLSRLVTILLQGAVVLMALDAAGAEHRVMVPATTTVGLIALLASLTLLGPDELGTAAPRIGSLALVLLTPAALVVGLVRSMREDGRVTIQTVYAALGLYLIAGMGFAFLFATIEDIGGVFFADGIQGTPNDFLYFSLATLTTTGYGDFSAATELGRAVAVSEALVGQIYLVTVIAVLVSNLGRQRREPA